MTRILNRQRQLAEQGRLRLGYTTETTTKQGKMVNRPVASATWIVTSHSQDYVSAASSLWGGQVEQWQPLGHGAEQFRVITQTKEIDAILPPGDPLTQAYELWSAGGCQRRCDGVTEQFTGSPCLCVARFGEKWYEQKPGVVCDTKSRLKVILPDMPGMGSWRVETGSFYAADEIAGMIDVIRGTVGDRELIPVRLRIEPRTSTTNNETRHFVVPVLELRGVTAGELLGGRFGGIAAVEAAKQQKALSAGTPSNPTGHQWADATSEMPDYEGIAKAATTLDEVRAVWHQAKDANHLTSDLETSLFKIGQRLNPGGQNPTTMPQEVAQRLDADHLWSQVVAAAGELGMTTNQLLEEFPQVTGGVSADDATGSEMQQYLNHLKGKQA